MKYKAIPHCRETASPKRITSENRVIYTNRNKKTTKKSHSTIFFGVRLL